MPSNRLLVPLAAASLSLVACYSFAQDQTGQTVDPNSGVGTQIASPVQGLPNVGNGLGSSQNNINTKVEIGVTPLPVNRPLGQGMVNPQSGAVQNVRQNGAVEIGRPAAGSLETPLGQSAAGVRKLQMKVPALQKDGMPVPDASKEQSFRELYEGQKERSGEVGDPAMMNAALDLPEIGSFGLREWTRRIVALVVAGKVDPMYAHLTYEAAIKKIGTYLKQGVVTPADAASMVAYIKESAKAQGISENGILLLARETFQSAANADESKTGKGVAALKAWNDLLTESGKPFILHLSGLLAEVQKAADAARDAASRQDPKPLPRLVEARIVGKGAQAAVVLEVRSAGEMPTEVKEIPALLANVALHEINSSDDQIFDPVPETMNSLVSSKMPVNFGAAYRRYRAEGNGVWTSFMMAFSRSTQGHASGLWAFLMELRDFLLGRNASTPFLHVTQPA